MLPKNCGWEKQILDDGCAKFAYARAPEDIVILLGVINRSFTENGPSLPVLLREISQLPPIKEDNEIEMSGLFVCNESGRTLRLYDKWLIKLIRGECTKTVLPYPFRENRVSRFSSFNKAQRVIMEAFFVHEGGELLLPNLTDVYAHYLNEQFGLMEIWESQLNVWRKSFVKQASQVLHKIRQYGQFTKDDYRRVTGLRAFEKIMSGILAEYADIAGEPITLDLMEKIALREVNLYQDTTLSTDEVEDTLDSALL